MSSSILGSVSTTGGCWLRALKAMTTDSRLPESPPDTECVGQTVGLDRVGVVYAVLLIWRCRGVQRDRQSNRFIDANVRLEQSQHIQ